MAPTDGVRERSRAVLQAAARVFDYLAVRDPLPEPAVDLAIGFGHFDPGIPRTCVDVLFAERARFIVNDNYKDLGESEKLELLIEENVIAQLDNLRTHPSVASRLMKGRVNLHGWVYNIQTGEVKHLDQATRKFIRLGEAKRNGQVGKSHA